MAMMSSTDFVQASERATAIATLNRQRHLAPSCAGWSDSNEERVNVVQMSTAILKINSAQSQQDHPMSHRPLWISNFTKPSSRIFNKRDWQASSFTTLARFMTS
jgi:hypothetical protein